MTKVQVTYDLCGAVDDAMLEQINRAHSVYGIEALRLAPALDALIVEFDASRLKPEDLDQTLRSTGLPVRRQSSAS